METILVHKEELFHQGPDKRPSVASYYSTPLSGLYVYKYWRPGKKNVFSLGKLVKRGVDIYNLSLYKEGSTIIKNIRTLEPIKFETLSEAIENVNLISGRLFAGESPNGYIVKESRIAGIEIFEQLAKVIPPASI